MRRLKINIYKENLLIIFTSLPIDKTCCLGLIERKPETDSSQYTVIGKYNLRTIFLQEKIMYGYPKREKKSRLITKIKSFHSGYSD